MLLSEAWKEYESEKKMDGYSIHTLKGYKLQADLFMREVGDMNIQEVTTNIIKSHLRKSAEHIKPSSLLYKMKYFRSFFRWCHDEDLIESNPATKLKDPKQEKRIPKFIPEETIEVIRSFCELSVEHALLDFLFNTGSRVSEVVGLNKSDIDLNNYSARVIGKGNKERVVYFTPKCAVWMKRYLEERVDNQEALFVTQRRFKDNGGQPRRMSTHQVRWILKRISKRAGIKNIHPHRYRHSLATTLLNNGADLAFIQSILGHASINTTRVYASLSDNKRRELYDKYI